MRARLTVRGAVQGVGFRPFVFRLATELALTGWVGNTAAGVVIEVEGPAARVEAFTLRIEPERPPRSFIQSLEITRLDPLHYSEFEIRASDADGEKTALVLPDIAVCAACLREVFDPANRRYRYPFTNCTHCGPRYSILRALPYDRPNTSMAEFALCPACRREYEDPTDRRFHAQPNACPECGPQLEFWDEAGRVKARRDAALAMAVAALRGGGVIAVKGLGGFHLMVRLADAAAVNRLRARKHREAKPLAVMCPDVEAARLLGDVSAAEARLLGAPEAPIVLLRRRRGAATPPAGIEAAAPGNPYLGVMLPYTPLHHLLLADLGETVVATSGNHAEEPICIDEKEALERLGGVADGFLVHNRPIVRQVDDSVARVVLGREMVVRRSRGYAPLPVRVAEAVPTALGVGAHLKNAVALAKGRDVFLSQHVGDLETAPALAAFDAVAADLARLYGATPEIVAADRHPDYLSSRRARASGRPVVCVQHHYAHVLSCMAENDLPAPLLGVSWDGTGLGTDDTIWGGEFLRITPTSFERVGHLREFRLPGGDKAVREPRRVALGLLHALWGDAAFDRRDLPTLQAFSAAELNGIRRMLKGSVNAPRTTSAGRLFDAVASLTGLRQDARFEGQAAMDLEFSLEGDETDEGYPLPVCSVSARGGRSGAATPPCPVHEQCRSLRVAPPRWVLDWGPLIEALVADLARQVPVWEISAKFHNGLVDGMVDLAGRAGESRVVLTGGCFQNKYLLERAVQELRSAGFSPYWHQRVPTNDGGLALGQVMAAARARKSRKR
ncbi:MAG TPA: carbamoyltransferase HypF [Verrucomicrobiota bacterium]|nr:carbamoyltransferase HypF [Verrucomicrobiota bacterium]HNU49307.1 carbamoyltransferase HypF [Verrucomicrobiota bacterium]